ELNEIEDGMLEGYFIYNTDLFDESFIARMAGHYQNLLQELIANRDRCLSELEMLGPDELRTILYEWNNSDKNFPRDKFVHELIDEQATRTPDRVAVIFEGRQMTYKELNQRSDSLA